MVETPRILMPDLWLGNDIEGRFLRKIAYNKNVLGNDTFVARSTFQHFRYLTHFPVFSNHFWSGISEKSEKISLVHHGIRLEKVTKLQVIRRLRLDVIQVFRR